MENSRLLLNFIIVWIRFLLLEELENASSHRQLSLPRLADAAVWRGQKLTLALSTLAHQLQMVIKHVRRERAGQQDWAQCSDFLDVCTKAHFVPNKIIFNIQFSCYFPGD